MHRDIEKTGGIFVYLFSSLEERYEFDYWFLNDDELSVFLQEDWGVTQDDFQPYSRPELE
ncbi:MAG: hypothetical protein AB1644_03490 [Candidatus Zixiibacteriota bacterium]